MKNYKYIFTHSSANLTLTHNPINWAKKNMEFVRSERYHSILRSSIIELEIPFAGKTYIDTIYSTYGIDTDISLEIQVLDKSDFTYSTEYTGIVDLSEWTSMRDTTSVKIIDSSVMAKFAARDNIKVPLNREEDLDGNAVSSYTYLNDVTVEGVDIEEQALYEDATNEIPIDVIEGGNFTRYKGVTGDDYQINMIGGDAELPPVALFSASGVLYTNSSGFNETIRYRIVTAIDGTISVAATSAWTWAYNVYLGKNGTINPISLTLGGSSNNESNITDSHDTGYVEVIIADGETIELYHEWSGTVQSGDFITPNLTVEPTYIEIYTIQAGAIATEVPMPLVHEFGAKLLEIITGVSDPLNAPMFGRTDSEPRTYGSDGDYSIMGIASGYNLRGFPFADQPSKASFRDFFKSIDALFNLGMWYDGSEFIIGDKEDFYKDSEIISLGEVKELEITIARDQYFNRVIGGYNQVSYEEVNGQQVPNVSAEHGNDGQRIQGDLNISSPFRADDYGIELSRRSQFISTAGEDTKFDADNFFLNLQRDSPYTTLQGYDNFVTILNVFTPDSRLNLDLTPKRNLLRHLNQLSVPVFLSGSDVQFISTQFNLPLETKKSTESANVKEIEGILNTDLDEPLYYPEVYNFTAPLTDAIIQQLRTDPHGYVSFDSNGVTYTGFILEVSTEPFMRKGNWTLIKRNPNR